VQNIPQGAYVTAAPGCERRWPRSELIAGRAEWRPFRSKDEAFSRPRFANPGFKWSYPSAVCWVLAYGEMLQGRSYRARSVHLSAPP